MIHKSLYSSRSEEWSTPQALFNQLDAEFHFTLDPCATPENAKCQKFFTKQDDGLSQEWAGERVFLNPPYGRQIKEWIKKAATSKTLVVALIHARTDTRWWHEWVEPYAKEIRFIKGRVCFDGPHDAEKNPTNRPTFPSVLVVWKADAGGGDGE